MSTSPPTLIPNSLRCVATPANWTGYATTMGSTSLSRPGSAVSTADTSPACHTLRGLPRASPGCEPGLPVFYRIVAAREADENLVVILPVGPVPQYAIAARIINERRISLKHVHTFNMDEYA